MIPRITEWYSENANRAYPFKSTADLSAVGPSSAQLPHSAILDLRVTIKRDVADSHPLYLTSFTGGTTALLGFTYDDLQFTIAVPGTVTAPVSVEGMTESVFYHIVVGSGISELIQDIGNTTITFEDAEVEPATTYIQGKDHVSSIQATTPNEESAILTGDIKVVDGYNCAPQITVDGIHLSARRGAGAGRYCEPLETDYATCKDVFLNINGQTADANGNIALSVSGLERKRDESRPNTLILSLPKHVYENLGC